MTTAAITILRVLCIPSHKFELVCGLAINALSDPQTFWPRSPGLANGRSCLTLLDFIYFA